MKKYILSLLLFIFVICISSKPLLAIEYNSSLFPIGYQGSNDEKVVFYSKTLKYEDNYYLEGATLEVTDDSHEDYVIVTFRHYVGHSGDYTHSNYMVVPCAFYIDDKKICEWFISGYDHRKGSQYDTGYRFRNTYRCVFVKEGIKIPRGRSIKLSAYDVGEDDETVAPLIWSRDYIYEYSTYSLTVDFSLDGILGNDCKNYGTFDLYVDNKLIGNDMTSYSGKLYYKQKYEIRDIRANIGKQYNKNKSKNLKGTIMSDSKALLDFSTKVYQFDIEFDHNIYGKNYNEGARVYSFDLYKNGILIGKNIQDYRSDSSYYNDIYMIKNIVYRDKCGYKNIDAKASYSYYDGEIHIVHDIDDHLIFNINTILFDHSGSYAYIRFISKDYIDTLSKESIWAKEEYKSILMKSLNNDIPVYHYYIED